MWVCLLILVLSVFILADAFGSGKKEGSQTAGEEPVTLDYWHMWGGYRTELMETSCKNFMEKHPNIKVKPQLIAIKGIAERINTALVGGNPPDIMGVYTDVYPRAASQGYFADLTERARKDNIKGSDYISGLWDMLLVDGKLYGLPNVVNGVHFFYWNKAMFKEAGYDPDKAPPNWSDMEQKAVKLTKTKAGKLDVVGLNVMEYNFGAALMFMKFIYNNGGSLLSDDGRKVTFNTPEGKETVELLIRLADKQGGIENIIALQSQFIEASGSTYPFFFGKEAMIFSGVYLLGMVKDAAPDLDFGMAPIPVGPSGKGPRDLHLGTWSWVIPKASEKQDAAWELVKWIGNGDGHRDFMKAQLRPSMVRKHNEVDNLEYYKANNPHWDTIVEVMGNGVGIPANPVSGVIDESIKQFTEEAIYRTKTIDEALSWGEKQIQAALDEFYKK
jgi:multiple sugar transport system substrate-binding protein